MTVNIHIVKPYMQLMRLDRPIGTLLLLWPALIAVWLATNGNPSPKIIVIFVLGVIIMRAAGCVINDYADRKIDPHITRTKLRPLARGAVTTAAALRLFVLLLGLAFILVLNLNIKTVLLSVIGAALAMLYPFAKRFTGYPQFVLGLAFAWSIPMAYMQVTGSLGFEAVLLYVSILTWVVAYDTQYAMVDKDDDLLVGVKSTAISFGRYDKAVILSLQLLTLLGLSVIGVGRQLNWCYFLGLVLALCAACYQQWLIKDRIPSRCFAAFLSNNYFGALIFLGLVFDMARIA